MSKFSSYEYSPYETRKILRTRFTSNLTVTNTHPREINEENLVDDILAVDYLSKTDIKDNAYLITSKSDYENTKQPQHIDISFDELISQGWVKLVWGKLRNIGNIRKNIYSVKDDKYSAIKSLLLSLGKKRILSSRMQMEKTKRLKYLIMTTLAAFLPRGLPQDYGRLRLTSLRTMLMH